MPFSSIVKSLDIWNPIVSHATLDDSIDVWQFVSQGYLKSIILLLWHVLVVPLEKIHRIFDLKSLLNKEKN